MGTQILMWGGVRDSGNGSTAINHAWGGRFSRYQLKSTQEVEDGQGDTRENLTIPIIPKLQKLDWDVAPPQEYFDELMRISKNQIIWGGNYFYLPPTRCFLVWRKLSISESFTMAMAEYAWTSFNGNAKVFECAPQGKKTDMRFHPTQKPLELYAWIYRMFAKAGDKVFDSMMGSQSSRIAAYHAGLDFYGCEIDKRYFTEGNKRFEKMCLGKEVVAGHDIVQQSLF